MTMNNVDFSFVREGVNDQEHSQRVFNSPPASSLTNKERHPQSLTKTQLLSVKIVLALDQSKYLKCNILSFTYLFSNW